MFTWLTVKTWLSRLLRIDKSLGARGEKAACRYLRRSGYKILARNLRSRLGELDIIVEDKRDRSIAIIEVKATVSEDPPPEVHVNRRKQQKISALAGSFVRRYRLQNRRIRFDVVAVVWPSDVPKPTRITHHVGAFESQL